jgi:hypothetical protein
VSEITLLRRLFVNLANLGYGLITLEHYENISHTRKTAHMFFLIKIHIWKVLLCLTFLSFVVFYYFRSKVLKLIFIAVLLLDCLREYA